jgi:hypothetical protein
MDQSTRPGAVLSVEAIERDWCRLIELGPRFPGTPNNDATIAYLTTQLGTLPYRVWEHEFGYLGWGLEAPPTLRVVSPESIGVACQAFIYCGPTSADGVRGELEYVGEHWVIGLLKWPKFAIRNSAGEVVGYVSGRTDGPAIPQPLSERSSLLPHFIVGRDDLQRLREWTAAGQRITVEGALHSRLAPQARLRNLIASTLPAESNEARIGLCAHLDSMYTCPGANDNGGGLAALLALARHYARHPPIIPLEFIFFNGEEWDLAGSKAFVARHVKPSQAGRYKLLFNLDGISETVDGLQFWVGPEGFAQELKEAVDAFRGQLPAPREYKFPPPLGSDHVPFYNVGVPVCMFTGYDIRKYHLPTDVYWPGGVESIHRVAELTRHLIDHFARRDTRYESRETLLGGRPYYWSVLEGRD